MSEHKFQPHVEAVLAVRPELRERFQYWREDGWPTFVEVPDAWYDEEAHGWESCHDMGRTEGVKVIDGHQWRVWYYDWTDETVLVDGVVAPGPDFNHNKEQVFELIDLGFWETPDFARVYREKLQMAEQALVRFDAETADRPRRREALVAVVEECREKVQSTLVGTVPTV